METPQYFLDTNLLVHLIRGDGVGRYLIDKYSLYTIEPRPMISDVSEGELRSLALLWNWGPQKQSQMQFLLGYFWRIAINEAAVFEAYAAIDVFGKSHGHSMGKNDLWIAASAHAYQAHLLTTDKDFNHLHAVFLLRDYLDPANTPPKTTGRE